MAKAKAKGKKKKRKAPPHLKVWRDCWKEIGHCPLTEKTTEAIKKKARACVERKMGKKAKKKK